MDERKAIRRARRGAAHLWINQEVERAWADAACGRALSNPEVVLWSSTAPEDRCKRCAAIAGSDA